jgi:hypothetical protein
LDDNFLNNAIFRGTSANVKVTKSTVSFSSNVGGQWNQTIRPGPQRTRRTVRRVRQTSGLGCGQSTAALPGYDP